MEGEGGVWGIVNREAVVQVRFGVGGKAQVLFKSWNADRSLLWMITEK